MKYSGMDHYSDDELLTWLGSILEAGENIPAAVNNDRVKELQYVYNILDRFLLHDGMKLSYKINEPFKNYGSVTIEGDVLSFTDSEMFARLTSVATILEVYPLTDGNVRMSFGFSGLTD